MDYFVLEQVKHYKTGNIAGLQAIDFIEKDFLISE